MVRVRTKVRDLISGGEFRPMARDLRIDTAPHVWEAMGWRRWLCRHCYAPKKLHPRLDWARSRALGDHRYLSVNAPHFKEGW